MHYNILTRVIKYYTRLEGMSETSLLYRLRLFTVSKLNDNRLCNIVRYAEEQLYCTTENLDFKNRLSVTACIRNIKIVKIKYFENLLLFFVHSDENKRQCTYKYFKNMFCVKPYLHCIKDPYIRRELTCFRISVHGLRV